MSETEQRADHLWSADPGGPPGASIVRVEACCDLPQSAHDGVTWDYFLRAVHTARTGRVQSKPPTSPSATPEEGTS